MNLQQNMLQNKQMLKKVHIHTHTKREQQKGLWKQEHVDKNNAEQVESKLDMRYVSLVHNMIGQCPQKQAQ